ncbi:MAG: hypothetical protein ACR2ND_11645, partial [Solirubrobacteraceae bacterium]
LGPKPSSNTRSDSTDATSALCDRARPKPNEHVACGEGETVAGANQEYDVLADCWLPGLGQRRHSCSAWIGAATGPGVRVSSQMDELRY